MKTHRKFLSLVILFTLAISFGCGKKNNNDSDLPAGKTIKFTVTATGLLASDDFDILFTGSDVQGTATTLFKVDGVAQNSQRAVTITNAQLRAKQVVVETATPLFTVVVSPSGSSSAANHSFSFKIEPVVDGKAQAAVNKTVGYSAYSEQFTY